MEKVHSAEPRQYPTSFGEGRREKCHIQLLRCNELWKLASGLPDHDVMVLDETGVPAGSLHVAHTQAGIDEMKRFLLDIAKTPEQLACIVETSQGLLITALLEAGFTVYPVNPKTIDRRRNAAGVKTDAVDAYVLAKTGRSDLEDLRPLKPDTPVIAELKLLTRDQDSLIQSQTRLVELLHEARAERDEAKRLLRTERVEAEQRAQAERAELEQRYHKLLQEHMQCGVTIAKLEA